MSRGCPGNDRLLKMFFFYLPKNPYIFVSIHSVDGYKEKVSCFQMIQIKKCRRRICSNLSDFVQIWNISNIGNEKSVKLNLFYIFKFGFDWLHRIMLNGTCLKLI